MTTDVEDRLTTVLYAEAAGAPPAGDLLAGVRARARQRGRRRVAMVSSAAAIAAVIVVAVTSAVIGGGTESLRTPNQLAHPVTGGELVAGSEPLLSFPLTAGWLPDGLAKTPVVSRGDGGYLAGWRAQTAGTDGPLSGVDIWTSNHDVSTSGDGVSRKSTTFDGHAAVLASTQGLVSLGWQTTTGDWRAVNAMNRWADEQVVRHIAAELQDQPMTVASPFTMRLLPRDSTLVDWSTDGRFTFVGNKELARWRTSPTSTVVQIAARRFRSDLAGQGDVVTVQGQRGWLSSDKEGWWTLRVQLNAQTLLEITTPGWPRDDVLRLGEATHYNGGIPQAEG